MVSYSDIAEDNPGKEFARWLEANPEFILEDEETLARLRADAAPGRDS